MSKKKRKEPVPATGTLREKAKVWWETNMNGHLIEIYIKGDGYLRFEWRDDDERSSYHIPASAIL